MGLYVVCLALSLFIDSTIFTTDIFSGELEIRDVCYKSWTGLVLTKTRREGPTATSMPSRGRDQEKRETAGLDRLRIMTFSFSCYL